MLDLIAEIRFCFVFVIETLTSTTYDDNFVEQVILKYFNGEWLFINPLGDRWFGLVFRAHSKEFAIGGFDVSPTDAIRLANSIRIEVAILLVGALLLYFLVSSQKQK